MSRLDGETKRKLREMNAGELLAAIDGQDETLSIGMPFEERVRLLVDDAYSTFTHSKVEGLIRRAGLRYPNADLRRIDLLDERGLNRGTAHPARRLLLRRPTAERCLPGIHRIGKIVSGMRCRQTRLRTPYPRPLRPHA